MCLRGNHDNHINIIQYEEELKTPPMIIDIYFIINKINGEKNKN